MGDSQSNLKPLAAKNIALILGSVDGVAQAKLGKIVYGPLIAAAINDNKKIMRDASMDALEKATTKSEIDGGGVNRYAMEPLMSACASELLETGQKVSTLFYYVVLRLFELKLTMFFFTKGCWFTNCTYCNIPESSIFPSC